jgi:hypothetical protein
MRDRGHRRPDDPGQDGPNDGASHPHDGHQDDEGAADGAGGSSGEQAPKRRDISDVLADWPYESGKLSARLIMGEDGEPRLQVRLDLGVLQMHLEGRPDGQRPRGFESLLEYHEARLDDHVAAHEGSDEGYELSGDDCRELREEAVQYYQRYTGLLVMDDYEGVVRDTTRNLRVLDLCRKHASGPEDRGALEQFRPYIMMTRARALASQAIKDNEPKAALLAVEEGIEALRRHFEEMGQEQMFEASSEAQLLLRMREELLPKQPISKKDLLKRRLAEAVAGEKYELAAKLRDELKAMPEGA